MRLQEKKDAPAEELGRCFLMLACLCDLRYLLLWIAGRMMMQMRHCGTCSRLSLLASANFSLVSNTLPASDDFTRPDTSVQPDGEALAAFIHCGAVS